MMIHKTQSGSTVTLAVSGRLDVVTQPELAQELEKVFETGLTGLVFDFSELDYISSAGLRVLLTALKKTSSQGATMKIVGAKPAVKEILRITGFDYEG